MQSIGPTYQMLQWSPASLKLLGKIISHTTLTFLQSIGGLVSFIEQMQNSSVVDRVEEGTFKACKLAMSVELAVSLHHLHHRL